jgi:hypothetical protein
MAKMLVLRSCTAWDEEGRTAYWDNNAAFEPLKQQASLFVTAQHTQLRVADLTVDPESRKVRTSVGDLSSEGNSGCRNSRTQFSEGWR